VWARRSTGRLGRWQVLLRTRASLHPSNIKFGHRSTDTSSVQNKNEHNTTHTGALEELWKARPDAGLDDLESGGRADGQGAGGAAELTPVALRYDDAAQYQVRADGAVWAGGGRL